MNGVEIGRAVSRWEGDRWGREVESKTTLQLYRSKTSIGDEEMYNNSYGSALLFQCRTNTLRLRWRQGFGGGAVDCPLSIVLCRRQLGILSSSVH